MYLGILISVLSDTVQNACLNKSLNENIQLERIYIRKKKYVK
jgi:hypothetical protein